MYPHDRDYQLASSSSFRLGDSLDLQDDDDFLDPSSLPLAAAPRVTTGNATAPVAAPATPSSTSLLPFLSPQTTRSGVSVAGTAGAATAATSASKRLVPRDTYLPEPYYAPPASASPAPAPIAPVSSASQHPMNGAFASPAPSSSSSSSSFVTAAAAASTNGWRPHAYPQTPPLPRAQSSIHLSTSPSLSAAVFPPPPPLGLVSPAPSSSLSHLSPYVPPEASRHQRRATAQGFESSWGSPISSSLGGGPLSVASGAPLLPPSAGAAATSAPPLASSHSAMSIHATPPSPPVTHAVPTSVPPSPPIALPPASTGGSASTRSTRLAPAQTLTASTSASNLPPSSASHMSTHSSPARSASSSVRRSRSALAVASSPATTATTTTASRVSRRPPPLPSSDPPESVPTDSSEATSPVSNADGSFAGAEDGEMARREIPDLANARRRMEREQRRAAARRSGSVSPPPSHARAFATSAAAAAGAAGAASRAATTRSSHARASASPNVSGSSTARSVAFDLTPQPAAPRSRSHTQREAQANRSAPPAPRPSGPRSSSQAPTARRAIHVDPQTPPARAARTRTRSSPAEPLMDAPSASGLSRAPPHEAPQRRSAVSNPPTAPLHAFSSPPPAAATAAATTAAAAATPAAPLAPSSLQGTPATPPRASVARQLPLATLQRAAANAVELGVNGTFAFSMPASEARESEAAMRRMRDEINAIRAQLREANLLERERESGPLPPLNATAAAASSASSSATPAVPGTSLLEWRRDDRASASRTRRRRRVHTHLHTNDGDEEVTNVDDDNSDDEEDDYDELDDEPDMVQRGPVDEAEFAALLTRLQSRELEMVLQHYCLLLGQAGPEPLVGAAEGKHAGAEADGAGGAPSSRMRTHLQHRIAQLQQSRLQLQSAMTVHPVSERQLVHLATASPADRVRATVERKREEIAAAVRSHLRDAGLANEEAADPNAISALRRDLIIADQKESLEQRDDDINELRRQLENVRNELEGEARGRQDRLALIGQLHNTMNRTQRQVQHAEQMAALLEHQKLELECGARLSMDPTRLGIAPPPPPPPSTAADHVIRIGAAATGAAAAVDSARNNARAARRGRARRAMRSTGTSTATLSELDEDDEEEQEQEDDYRDEDGNHDDDNDLEGGERKYAADERGRNPWRQRSSDRDGLSASIGGAHGDEDGEDGDDDVRGRRRAGEAPHLSTTVTAKIGLGLEPLATSTLLTTVRIITCGSTRLTAGGHRAIRSYSGAQRVVLFLLLALLVALLTKHAWALVVALYVHFVLGCAWGTDFFTCESLHAFLT